MPYFVPTQEAAANAAFGRSLMGIGPLNYYLPNIRRDINGLGALRFNRAVARGAYQSPFFEAAPSGRLGQIEADPGMLFGGIALFGLGMLLLGKKGRKGRRRR